MLRWLRDNAFVLDGLMFRVIPPLGHFDSTAPPLAAQEFHVRKSPAQLEYYSELLPDLRPQRILELGVLHGGSTVFLSTLAKPQKYVAIDLEDQSTRAFETWLQSGPLKDRVRVLFGIDQSDAKLLLNIVAAEFGEDLLDLVVDDASHLLVPTRTSFNILFPYLRPGGIYVIEDWDAQHLLEQRIEREMRSDPGARQHFAQTLAHVPEVRCGEPLTKLVFEIILVAAYTDIIDDIRVRHSCLFVRRGSEPVERTDFSLSNHYLMLGRELLAPPRDRGTSG